MTLARQSLAALALTVLSSGPVTANEIDVSQLPQGDPARKLAVLHLQEVHISRIVASVCFVDAGVDPDRHRQIAYTSRDMFEATLPDLAADVAALDPKDPAVRRLQGEFGKKKKLWYRFRVFFEHELKAEEPSPDVLAQLALMEGGLNSAIERLYRLVKKKMAKRGQIDLAQQIQERSTFALIFKAQRVVEEACLVSIGAGDALERAKLGEAIEHLEQELEDAASGALVDASVKALIPRWTPLLQELRGLATGDSPADDLLPRLQELQDQWEGAMNLDGMFSALG
ncbi:MAG: hypothetical protein AAF677_05280 [Pseudomonadota bacterium]